MKNQANLTIDFEKQLECIFACHTASPRILRLHRRKLERTDRHSLEDEDFPSASGKLQVLKEILTLTRKNDKFVVILNERSEM